MTDNRDMETTVTLTVNGTQGDYFVACEDYRGTHWVFEVSDWADTETWPTEVLWAMDDQCAEDPTTSREDFELLLDGVLDAYVTEMEA